MRQRDDGDAGDKCDAAQRHQRLASHPVGQQPGYQRGDDAAQQNRGDDDRKLFRIQVRSGFEIRQRAADDADVDAVQQAAEARHQQKKLAITESLICSVGG